MGSGNGVIGGVALVAFALGALLIALGDRRRGVRAIGFALVLAAVQPLLITGLGRLQHLEVPHGQALDRIILALFLAAVALAGLVALRRTRGGSKSAEATSQKKRVERAP